MTTDTAFTITTSVKRVICCSDCGHSTCNHIVKTGVLRKFPLEKYFIEVEVALRCQQSESVADIFRSTCQKHHLKIELFLCIGYP